MDSFDDISRGGASAEPAADGGADHYPTGFGRGWIPAGRDIGVGGDDVPSLSGAAASAAFAPASFAVAPALRQAQDKLPAEGRKAGAYPGYPCDAEGGGWRRGWDGPLPAQGRREHCATQCAPVLRRDGWTPALKARFLDALAGHGNVRAACGAVGMSAEAAYRLRRREALFARGWAAALVVARGHAEQVLADRAMHGVTEPIFYRGEQVGARVRFDSRLLLAHLARLDKAAEDERAAAHAERFDELVALVAGARPDAAMFSDEDGREEDALLPLARAAYVAKAEAEAESEALWDLDDPYGDGAGADDADGEDDEEEDEDADPVLVARESAGVAAGAEWDAWTVQAWAVADAVGEGGILPAAGSGTSVAGEGAWASGPEAFENRELSLPVAPAEAGAHPTSRSGGEGGVVTRAWDGPLPPGLRPEVYPEPVEGQGRRGDVRVDKQPAEPPIEFKSLDGVNRVNFAAAPGARPGVSSGQFREAGRIPPCGQGQTWALAAATR